MKLTDKQKMLIWRLRNNMSQKQAAEHFTMKLHTYRDIESGGANLTVGIRMRIADITPTNREICKLLAREECIDQVGIASSLRLSRQYVNMMENGKAPETHLVNFWKDKGYKDLFNANEKS